MTTTLIINDIALEPQSGSSFIVPLGNEVVTFIPRFNYSAEAWSVDLFDADGEALITGLMLFPGFDLLLPYPQLKRSLGSLYVIERYLNDHKNPDMLGSNVRIVWYAPGSEVILTE